MLHWHVRSFSYALVLIAVVALAGCKKGDTLVGKWSGSLAGAPQGTTEFDSDNTFKSDIQRGTMRVEVGGTYATDNDKLTITIKSVDFPGAPAAQAAMLKKLASGTVGKSRTVTYKLDGDNLAISDNGKTATLTRAKDNS